MGPSPAHAARSRQARSPHPLHGDHGGIFTVTSAPNRRSVTGERARVQEKPEAAASTHPYGVRGANDRVRRVCTHVRRPAYRPHASEARAPSRPARADPGGRSHSRMDVPSTDAATRRDALRRVRGDGDTVVRVRSRRGYQTRPRPRQSVALRLRIRNVALGCAPSRDVRSGGTRVCEQIRVLAKGQRSRSLPGSVGGKKRRVAASGVPTEPRLATSFRSFRLRFRPSLSPTTP
ncbi:MAG: hypothetical protein KatS3mg076_1996 [Candidatus Binatia bacterium]|nr:MAG: hypothetical protein KatS3mg076_1996 [Candidatus Binatia bacterium]